MKLFKKIGNIFLVIVLLCCSFFVSPTETKAEASTLRELREEYNQKLEEYNKNKEEEKLTKEEITKINSNIVLIQSNIEKGQQEIIVINNEIADLEIKMAEKDKEIKKILNFLQVSEGENVYLEYAFGAQTFTDFIYRMAVTEQLSDYNDKLIKEFNEMIETNKKKKEDIAAKEVEMKKQQADMKVQLSKLESHVGELYEDYIDISASLETQKTIIDAIEAMGCGLDENIGVCAANTLLNDTSFWRPTTSGYMSSNYGMRWHPTQGIYKLHTGVDIAMPSWTPVYSVALGIVRAVTHKYYCGGNMIFITHRVNGRYYTSVYMHLSSINVNVGDLVTKDTIIGYSGGDPNVTTWDQCTTGGHLHLSMLYGQVGIDYYAWSNEFYASLIDPRQVINLPGLYGSYYNRTTRY